VLVLVLAGGNLNMRSSSRLDELCDVVQHQTAPHTCRRADVQTLLKKGKYLAFLTVKLLQGKIPFLEQKWPIRCKNSALTLSSQQRSAFGKLPFIKSEVLPVLD
jgi:hypothetical protein